MCQTRINLFFSLFLQKIRRPVLVSDKLKLGIFPIVPVVSLKVSPVFRSTEATFDRCCTNVVFQQKDVMKYNLLHQRSKARKRYKQICQKLYSMKGISQAQNNIEKYLPMAPSEDNYFLRQYWMASSQTQLRTYINFKVGLSSHLIKKVWFICFNENDVFYLKNAFDFILNAFAILKLLKCFAWRFGRTEKTAWLKR